MIDAADALARRLLTAPDAAGDDARADRLFLLLFNTPPDGAERAELLTYIHERASELESEGDAEPQLHAWSAAAHAMFSTSRFQFLD